MERKTEQLKRAEHVTNSVSRKRLHAPNPQNSSIPSNITKSVESSSN